MAEGDTWVNALIGAVVTTVLGGLVPLAPLLGGGVAGYLEGDDRSVGLKVGAISGAMALIPFLLLLIVMSTVIGTMGMGFGIFGTGGAMFGAGLGLLVLFVALFFGLIYVIGLSTVGGWLGNYVKNDTDVDI